MPRLDPIRWTERQKHVLWSLDLARDVRSEKPRKASARRFVATALEITAPGWAGKQASGETKRP